MPKRVLVLMFVTAMSAAVWPDSARGEISMPLVKDTWVWRQVTVTTREGAEATVEGELSIDAAGGRLSFESFQGRRELKLTDIASVDVRRTLRSDSAVVQRAVRTVSVSASADFVLTIPASGLRAEAGVLIAELEGAAVERGGRSVAVSDLLPSGGQPQGTDEALVYEVEEITYDAGSDSFRIHAQQVHYTASTSGGGGESAFVKPLN